MDDLPSSKSPTDKLLRTDTLNKIQTYASEALTEIGTGAAKAAQSRLARLDLKVARLSDSASESREGRHPVLVAPDMESVGDLTLPVELNPPERYKLDRSAEEVQIRSRLTGRPRRVSIEDLQNDELGDDEFEFLPEEHLTVLKDALHSVGEAVDKDGNPQSQLPALQAMKEPIRERLEERKDEARVILERIQGVLFAWALVALKGESHGPIPPKEGREAHFWPETDYLFGSPRAPNAAERESRIRLRKGIQQNFSETGLFVREVRHLWELIVGRRLGKHRMRAVAAPLDVPQAVTEAAASAVEALYDELVSIDEKIAALQAREVALKIGQNKSLPSSLDTYNPNEYSDVSPAYRTRTITIGKALKEYRAENEELPNFDKGELKQFGVEADPADDLSRNPVYYALDATGCWVDKTHGSSDGVKETMRRAIKFAETHER